jgi:hypothetical protein
MKRCKNEGCPLPQPLAPSKFNKRIGVSDGLQPICRVCQSMANAKNRSKHIAKRQVWKENPAMFRALRRIRYAVRTGKLKRGPCEVETCQSTKNIRAYLSTPESTKPKWFCWAHHPNRSGNPVDPDAPKEES